MSRICATAAGDVDRLGVGQLPQLHPFELGGVAAEVLVGEGGGGERRDQADRDHDQRAARGSALLAVAPWAGQYANSAVAFLQNE